LVHAVITLGCPENNAHDDVGQIDSMPVAEKPDF
jgi:hypothetical protein